MKVKSLVLNGYYGLGNAGDEAVLACALDEIRSLRPDIGITVLSGNPEATAQRYGVRSVKRKSLSALRAIASSDLYVCGGGSLLQDATSAASVAYYVALMAAARLFGKPYAIYANGIGPLNRGWVRGLVRMIVDGASSVSVRDAGSMRLIEEIGSERKDIVLTSDPVFSIRAAGTEEVVRQVGRAAGAETADLIASSAGRLGIFSLRDWEGLDDGMQSLCEMARLTRKAGFVPLGLAFQPGSDEGPLRRMKAACGEEMPVVPCDFHPDVAAGIFSLAGITVGMRLHSLIMSAAAGVPALGISYDPKVDALFEMMPLGRCVKVSDLRNRGVSELSSLLDGLQSQRDRIAATLPSVKARAAGTADFMLRKAEETR